MDEELCILYPRLSAADQKARATFQRQGLNQKAVELLFIGLKSIYIKCRGDADDGIINFVAITEDGGRGDRRFLAKSSSAPEVEPIFSICARSIYWRVL
ncbi:hypothetical protein [Pseudomonas sp. 273]|uniref:hypothetical protein n=1 Tax=Pseudomonas sp. 273 TaxID=75692 RepID=UPI0023D84FC8|nr:hypothetical protein [Pseudomonas sp. 273]